MRIGTRIRQLFPLSAALNNTRRNNNRQAGDKGGPVVAATDISFTSPDTISSSGSGFPSSSLVGQIIEVAGSAANSRQWRVVTNSASTITVAPTQITTESSGALITIRTT